MLAWELCLHRDPHTAIGFAGARAERLRARDSSQQFGVEYSPKTGPVVMRVSQSLIEAEEILQPGQLLEMCQTGYSGSSVCYAVIIESPIWTMINTALTIAIASPNRVLAGDCPFVKPKLAMIVSINWTGMLRNNSFIHVD